MMLHKGQGGFNELIDEATSKTKNERKNYNDNIGFYFSRTHKYEVISKDGAFVSVVKIKRR